MYFPDLTRRDEVDYHNNREVFYADYKKNHKKVAEDCKHRCVYCDITSEEYGGDDMQLDHFRPQEHFDNLKAHPHNLYLSCPKCNVLKTSDWPCQKNKDDAPSFVGGIGYLDRFERKAKEFLEVDVNGNIIHRAGPVNYMIKKMLLNRPSRVNVRRKRAIEDKKTKIIKGIARLADKLTQDEEQGKITREQRLERMKVIRRLSHMVKSV